MCRWISTGMVLLLLVHGCSDQKAGSGGQQIPPTQGARSSSPEYQEHLAKQETINERLQRITLELQRTLQERTTPPDEQLAALKTKLRDQSAPAGIESRLDAIVAKQAEEGISPEAAREFCDNELAAVETQYPGFRQGLHEDYTFLSCVTADIERSFARIRHALFCQVTDASSTCFDRLSADEKAWADEVLAAVEE